MRIKQPASYRLATLVVLLIGGALAIFGQIHFYLGYYSSVVISNSYVTASALAIVSAVPVLLWFRNKYWYFPLFIPILWVPLTVLLMYLGALTAPLPEDSMSGSLLALLIHGLNLAAITVGVLLGLVGNAAWFAWTKFSRE